MRISFHKEGLLPAALAAGMLALGSCTNSDYDMNEVDMTMGFGGDSLVIPSSSTDIIKLSEVLELEEDGCVVLDADSNYLFRLAETSVSPAQPYVEKVKLEPKTDAKEYTLSLPSGAKQHATTRAASGEKVVEEEKEVMSFTFDGNSPEVKELYSATVEDTEMKLKLTFPSAMAACMPKINLTLNVPGYLKLKSASLNGSSGKASFEDGCVKLTDVPTSKPMELVMVINKLDFTSDDTKYGQLDKIVNGKIKINGTMTMSLEAELTAVPTVTSFTISSSMSAGEMVVTSAKGKFDPKIDLTDLGEVAVSGVPDFLNDDNVCIDLANPQLRLKVANNMDVAAKVVGGTIVAYKDGQEIAKVSLQDIVVNKKSETEDDTTRICICRTKEGVEDGWTPYEVANLSDIVRTIPDKIEITCSEVRADQSKEAEFEFGKQYTVTPIYSVEAPLSFGENAVIVYSDFTDGWNESIKDLKLTGDAYVEMTANVESRVPIYLDVKAEPVDEFGITISEDILKVEIPNGINASKDGETVISPISIKITQLDDDALKWLDGLYFTITGAASKDGKSVTGKTLNARDHTLKLTDIKIKIKGKVIGDFN